MPRIHPLHLFPPHIAERGLLYFQQGKVRDVQKTSSGRYRAEVCGSENYSVWLKLDSDLYIKDGSCDCPYGGACKHMAALWYAVRAQTQDNQQAVAYIKPRVCLRAHTLPMNHKEFEIYV